MAPDIVSDQVGVAVCNYPIIQTPALTCLPPKPKVTKNLKKESERLKTFQNWKVSFLDPKVLARDGFYFTNVADVVNCAFCNLQIGCWEEGDEPRNDHQRLSRKCPFVNGQDCGNIPISDDEEEEESREVETTSQDVCGVSGVSGLEIRPFSAPERPGKNPFLIDSTNLWRDFEDIGVSKISGPVAPYYATYESRLKSFENWTANEIQSPVKLAEAGFYYTSYQDNVLCFHCGGGLKNWEVEDDPWVEHARWFSKCGFVILQKGREFISDVLSKKKAYLSAETLKEIVNNCEASQAIPLPEVVEPPKEPSSSTQSSTATSSSTAEERSSPKPSEKELELCRICYTRERGIVFLPCGHFVSCPQCAPSLSSCAVCRKPFEATVRAYLS